MLGRTKILSVLVLVLTLATIAMPVYAATAHSPRTVSLPFALLAGMAIAIKSADAIATKYVNRAQGAGTDYTNGVNQPKRPWQSSTVAAAPVYAAGVNAAISNGSFAKGVTSAGDAKWQRKAAGVGAQRYGPGVTAAKSDYQAGVAPYLDVLSNLTLPPRQPKGSPGNVARVQAVADALRAHKLKG